MTEQVFGKYRLIRRIGVGGMAEVFKATKGGAEGFVKDLVIKRILPAYNEDRDFVRMFINEARLAARLQHTNIVQIFDFDNEDGSYYIAMEWVDGTDLKKVMDSARRRAMPLPMSFAVHVAVEALKGLHYAHSRTHQGKALQLVHRDISPHNLLVSFSGEVKITDFGIAKAAALAASTQGNVVKGKLPYMSPEQVLGQKLDARSDIFSLGIVLWEMLTAQRLYSGNTTAELISQVKDARVPAISSLNAQVPPELESVTMKMLAATTERRYSSAAEALADLSRSAEVGGALEFAHYLQQLLPEEATRERRGETDVMAEAGAVATAAPNAPTNTRRGSRAVVDVFGPPPTPAQAPPADSGAVAAEPLPQQPGAQKSATPLLLLSCVVCAGLFGVLGWWVVRPGKVKGAHGIDAAAVQVQTRPVGAQVWVDGVQMGRAPLKLAGPRGRTLQVQARLSGRSASQRVELGASNETIVLQLGGAGPQASGDTPPGPTSSATAGQGNAPSTVTDDKKDRSPSSADARPPAVVAKPDSRPKNSLTNSLRVGAPARSGIGRTAPKNPGRVARRRLRGSGTIDITVFPWAKVRIDGKNVGQTPLRGKRLTAGWHTIVVHNSELNRRRRLRVKIVAGGKATPIRLDWGK